MSLISSLYIGQNGLTASSLELGVIGDNIANAGTIGFKAGRASFAEMVGENLVGGGGELGLGTRLVAVQKILTQGALATTGLSTDLAISGPGLFVVRTPDGLAYTRNGQFTLSEDGFLVDLQGNRVQGFPADATGNVGGAVADLQPGQATSPAQATTTVTVRGNLDSRQTVDPTRPPFDPNDPEATSDFQTETQVFDSLGNPHDVTVYYRKVADAPQQWETHAIMDSGELAGGTPGANVEIGGALLTYDDNGNVVSQVDNPSNFFPAGITTQQPLAFDFSGMTATAGDTTDIEGTNSFVGQDGFGAGDLASVSVNAEGEIVGTFTNGQTRTLGQVGLADFPAPDQLQRAGNNLYLQSGTSGEPNIGAPQSGGRGALFAGTLEQSNVDVATELVRMIVVQRGFQANSKTVSTADSLLQELIQLKR